ncbi:MAG: alpha/beta fold hydrolase [Chroococcidiopsidaceae cyanobacterium CP_BM_RX_35]|nr:alpha/beta fold hydrolase [Chroococcidiopsidaceae cyanobacterium CP_BM_RX_35]
MAIEEHKLKVGTLEWFYRVAEPIGRTDWLPVLLLHGLPAHSYSWSEVMPTLALQGFRAIAPDWIGFGASAKPEQRDFAYTPDAFITALAEFIQALELKRFSLVVQGFLGSVGLQYAWRYPEQIERLIILNTPVATTAKLPWQLQQLGLPLIGDMLAQDPLLVDRTLERGSRYPISDADLAIYRQPFLKSSAAGRSLLATVRNLQMQQSMTEIADGWRAWTQPTAIIWGMKDPWLPYKMAQQLGDSLPQANLIPLEAAGHYVQEHWSEKVGDAIQLFLRRQANR